MTHHPHHRFRPCSCWGTRSTLFSANHSAPSANAMCYSRKLSASRRLGIRHAGPISRTLTSAILSGLRAAILLRICGLRTNQFPSPRECRTRKFRGFGEIGHRCARSRQNRRCHSRLQARRGDSRGLGRRLVVSGNTGIRQRSLLGSDSRISKAGATHCGFGASLECSRAMSENYPRNPYGHYAYGRALASATRLEEALTEQREEAGVSPKSVLPRIEISQLQLRLQHPQEALRAAEEAVQLAPDSAAAHKVLGQAVQAAGNSESAAM